MFGLFKKQYQIDISSDLATQMTQSLTDMYELLRSEAYNAQADWLKRIISAVDEHDTAKFKDLILSNELLGGSGSVIDAYLMSEEKQKKFDLVFKSFLDQVIKSGLTHRAVRQSFRILKR